jgi:hypothetical protein
MCLQTFLLSLASLEAAMLSWLLPVIIFDCNFFPKTGVSRFQVELSLDRIQASQKSFLGVC